MDLRRLTRSDGPALHLLRLQNRGRLTERGDWSFPDSLTVDDVIAEIEDPPFDKVAFGIWDGDAVVGEVSINPASPPHWAVGFWLDEAATGRGLATAACLAVADEARSRGAVDLYGLVTHGNHRSCRVLERAGFVRIGESATKSRWWLPLIDDPGLKPVDQ